MDNIDQRIYTPASVREMDRVAIEELGIDGYTLMCRAGAAAFADIRARYADARHWLVVCGAGNNAGDGYVIARLARAAGIGVSVVAIADPQTLRGDARTAFDDFQASGEVVAMAAAWAAHPDLIVDAMLGTGIDRPVTGVWREAIEAINATDLPVVAVDVPSGLNGATGAVMGAAVHARLTVTFVGRKQGFYLGAGPDHVGEVCFHDLEIPFDAVAHIDPALERFGADDLAALLLPRRATDHKGRFGHVLIVGGNVGMAGAARLAGEAALRSGAGLVSVATRPESVAVVGAGRPELMVRGVSSPADLDALLARASVVALGPGLGQDDWAHGLMRHILTAQQPKVLDADALNLLAGAPEHRDDWILTPHPGEAAGLLGQTTAELQAERLDALRALNERYGGVAVLKGRGSLIGAAGCRPWVIDAGNPGMATAGMGDVLTGICAGLLAQYPGDLLRSAAAAAFAHAVAGDRAAAAGPRGLLAGDLLAQLRGVLNPANL